MNVSSQANSLLREWERKSLSGLELELDSLTHANADNPADSERLELLEGIAEQMARMLETAHDSGEEADLYCGLLRHLSEPPAVHAAVRRSRRARG